MVETTSCSDLGLLVGYGLFETVRVYQGVPFLLEEHLRRMASSAEALELDGFSSAEAGRVVRDFLRKKPDPRHALRLSVTHGNPQEGIASRYWVKTRAVDYVAADYRDGIAAVVSASRRNERSEIVRHKTLNALENHLALRQAKRRGARESIFLNCAGCLCEGSISNLFWVSNGVLRTPALECGVLPGITRELILQLVAEKGIEVEEGGYHLGELLESDESFVCNSLMEIMPLVRVEGKRIAGGRPGPLTEAIGALYKKSVSAYVSDALTHYDNAELQQGKGET